MKTFYAFVLIAFLGLVILGCSESTDQLVAPVDKASTVSLEKGPVINFASANTYCFVEGKNAIGSFSARLYSDGSSDGEFEFNNHAMDPTLGNKWHGQVMFLKVYDGNTAVIGGIETGQYGFIGTYDVWIVVDNGEGANAPPDVRSTCIYWTDTLEDAERVWNLPPEQIITEMAKLWGSNEDEIMISIEMGNIQVR